MGFFSKLFGSKKEEPKQDTPQQPAQPKPEGDVHADDTNKDAWEVNYGVPQELAASEVLELYEQEERPIFLDVREPHELTADGFIPGSINIPQGELPARIGELEKSKPVVVYCASGMRSMDAGVYLLESGFREVVNLNGGLQNWTGPRETKSG